jgi:hypothetical protein
MEFMSSSPVPLRGRGDSMVGLASFPRVPLSPDPRGTLHPGLRTCRLPLRGGLETWNTNQPATRIFFFADDIPLRGILE